LLDSGMSSEKSLKGISKELDHLEIMDKSSMLESLLQTWYQASTYYYIHYFINDMFVVDSVY
jgi:hypothetical protein